MVPKLLSSMLVVAWLCTATAHAQESPGSDPLAGAVIPPDVIMTHQQELHLTDAQKMMIQRDAQSAQQAFIGVQWQLAAATEKLATLLKQTHVDQSRALAQLDTVLNLERQIKHTQITLMIGVKNALTPEQQATALRFAASPKHQ